jgi:DNA invertase Pin-like site-specific DNA recombinase
VSAQPRRRCAIYTRKSTTHGLEQEFNSLDAQREACESYIRSQVSLGWEKVATYDDGGFTGANIERPGFQRLLHDIDQGLIDVVVVYKVDRLSRSLLDFAKVMERFNKGNAAFVSVTQNFSTADAMGRLTLNILMSFAEFEREMIGERTRDKVQAARKKGRWTGGQVPLGYDLKEGKLVINELEALTVRDVFATYLEKRSSLEVVRALVTKGRPTKHHVSRLGRVRPPKPWDLDAVLRILKNPVYAGLTSCGDELFEGEHTGLVGREEFQRVQALLEGKQREREVKPSRYLLKDLVRCMACAGPMSPASTRRGGREYRYYRCYARGKQGKEVCTGKPMPAPKLEEFVVSQIGALATSPGFAADVSDSFEQQATKLEKELREERQVLPKAIAGLAGEAGRLTAAMANLSGTAKQGIDAQLQGVLTNLGQQEARLSEVERSLRALLNRSADVTWAANTLGNFAEMWPLMTDQMQQRLLHVLLERVEVDRATGKVKTVLTELGGTVTPRQAGGSAP